MISRITSLLFIIYLFFIIQYWEYIDTSRYNFIFDDISIISLVIVVTLSFFYLRRNKESHTIITPDKLFVFLYAIMVYPGIIFFAEGKFRNDIILMQTISFVIFVFTLLFFNHIFNKPRFTRKSLIIKSHSSARKEHAEIIKITVVVSIVSIVVYLISGNFNRSNALVAIIDFFVGADFEGIQNYREESYNTSGILNVLGNYIGVIVLPITSLFFIIEGLKQRSRKLALYGFLLFLICMIFSLGTGSRLMTMKILLFSLISYLMLYDFNFNQALRVLFLIFSVLIISTVILKRGNLVEGFGPTLARDSERAVSRILFVKGGASLIVYSYYPFIEDFENGKTMLTSLFGSSEIKNQTLAKKMFSFYSGGRLGTAGPQTFGDLYANFGYYGQIIGSVMIAFMISLITKIIYDRTIWKSYDIVFVSYLSLVLGYMGYSETMSFKSNGFHVILILYVFYKIFTNLLNRKKYS